MYKIPANSALKNSLTFKISEGIQPGRNYKVRGQFVSTRNVRSDFSEWRSVKSRLFKAFCQLVFLDVWLAAFVDYVSEWDPNWKKSVTVLDSKVEEVSSSGQATVMAKSEFPNSKKRLAFTEKLSCLYSIPSGVITYFELGNQELGMQKQPVIQHKFFGGT